MRSRQKSQAIVEFGIIALLFTGLMFATVDFGLLLNTWLSVSSGTREVVRNASVGKKPPTLYDEARHLTVPAIGTQGFAKVCCDASGAIEVRVEYLDKACSPSPASCAALPKSVIDSNYPYLYVDPGPGNAGGCTQPAPPAIPTCHPFADDLVRITVIAHGAQIITPLLRPAFGCTNGNNPNCYVPLTSSATMRYEGAEF